MSATPHVPLPAPANLAAYGGPGRVLLQWDAVAGAAGHEHRQSDAAAWRALRVRGAWRACVPNGGVRTATVEEVEVFLRDREELPTKRENEI